MTTVDLKQTLDSGIAHHQSGRLTEAEAMYRHVLACQPDHADALYFLGVVSFQKGRHEVAEDLLRRAIGLNPNSAAYYGNLGVVLASSNPPKLPEAIAAFRKAVSLQSYYPDGYANLANALLQSGRLDESIAAYRQAIAQRAEYPEAHLGLGAALARKGQPQEAITAYQQAIKLKPDYTEALNNLGNLFKDQGQSEAAIVAYRQALAYRPNYAEAWDNLGSILRELGQIEEAIAALGKAIQFRPAFPKAHYHLGLCKLMLGDLKTGWLEYAYRWQVPEFHEHRRNFTQPLWDGSDLSGRTILLYAEQGFGDAIQFARYVPLVANRGGRIILECPAQLQRLFQGIPGIEQVVPRGAPLRGFDAQCPLLNLPIVFDTTLQTIPSQTPYLFADAQLSGQWKLRIPQDDGRFKVGLVWAGRTLPDPARTVDSAALAPLSNLPGIWFCSLQKAEPGTPIQRPPPELNLTDWTAELSDFADTAALIDCLDLVVTIDTAVAHLAGAMGKPVWLLLPHLPDWRWMLGRSDSPWYPTMKLFRKPGPGPWNSTIEAVVEELRLISTSIRG